MTDTSELSAAEIFRRASEKDTPTDAPRDNPFVGLPGYIPPPTPRAPTAPYQGAILPFSKDETGNVTFDSNAGILGALKKPFDYTYDVRTGKIPADVRNPDYIGGALNTAMTYGPGAVASRVGTGGVIAPSQEALRASGDARFNAFRDSNQIFPTSDYQGFLQQTAKDLEKSGFYKDPGAAQHPHLAIQKSLGDAAKRPFITTAEIDALKTQLDASGLKGKELKGTMQAREALYDYLGQHGTDEMRKGVGDWRQMIHSEYLTGKDAAKSFKNTARAQGPELTARQARDSIAEVLTGMEKGSKATQGFTPAEGEALQKALTATPAIDRAQQLGNTLQFRSTGSILGGGGLVTSIGAALAGHPTAAAGLAAGGVALGAGGKLAADYANRGARRMAAEADNYIRGRSPLAAEQFATAPNNFTATPFARPVGTPSGAMISAAMEARRRELEQKSQAQPMYRVLPDGTIEELS